MRQSRRQDRSRWSTQGHLARHRQPATSGRQPLNRHPVERRRQHRVHHWRGLPRWRSAPAVATVAVKQASDAARIPGSGAASRAADKPMHPSRRPAQTPSRTRTTWIASRPRCSWATTGTEPTGSAAASPPATSFKSPNSSDRSASAGAFSSELRTGSLEARASSWKLELRSDPIGTETVLGHTSGECSPVLHLGWKGTKTKVDYKFSVPNDDPIIPLEFAVNFPRSLQAASRLHATPDA